MYRTKVFLYTLTSIAFVAMMAALYAIFIYVPIEEVMGLVQKIFYFHVPLAWVSFLAFFVVFVTSIMYLWKKERIFDIVAYSSAEIGVVFCTLVLITGPIWARPIWNTWWTWDPRLTTTLILWFIYVAYLMLRPFTENKARGANFAAVYGIVGFVNVPIVFMSIRWWRTIHPIVVETTGMHLAPSMKLTLLVSLFAFTMLYTLLLVLRVFQEELKDEIDEIKHQEKE
ncbi:cytochrome c biogenesis protein CcsA [Candidatus Poribacteria bacterium]|nr:cytochrome c biogenesis protein CcsA [Candidatus Poribacteria bacterium]